MDESAVGFEFENQIDHEAEVWVFATHNRATVRGLSLLGVDPRSESFPRHLDRDRPLS